jgi:NitT/TauT family transport system substrate-binding protein
VSERLLLTHGCSLSNLPLFVAEGAGLFAEQGLDVQAPPFTMMSSTAQLLASGAADIGTAAFIQPLIDCLRPNPPIMVAGSGLMGIVVLAQPGIRTIAELAGQRVGTFRGDPLEVLLHDALGAAGLSMAHVEVVYLDDIAGAIAMFAAGDLAAITLAEPHATGVRRLGAVELSDGTELWGATFPDTVLVASESMLNSRPDAVRAVIRAMLEAEAAIKHDPVGAIRYATDQYPGYDEEMLIEAAQRQPPCVDIRNYTATVLERWPALRSLGLVPADLPVPAGSIRLDLLQDELVLEEKGA